MTSIDIAAMPVTEKLRLMDNAVQLALNGIFICCVTYCKHL